MRTTTFVFQLTVLFFLLVQTNTNAQDSIVRMNGTIIMGKVSQIGNNSLVYKKAGMDDGPTYTEDIKNISYIRYSNGTKEVYAKSTIPLQNTDGAKIDNTKFGGTQPATTTPSAVKTPEAKMPENTALANGPVSNQYRIEYLDSKFKVNGNKISQNGVDKLLLKSTNPTVVAMARTAKLCKTFQKISKITAYPSTIGGGFASIATFSRMYEQIQGSGASFAACKDFGLSFLGTMTMPITAKILKNRKEKLYDKAIDLYNLSN